MPILDLPPRWSSTVQELLATHVPEAEVWAYGSRVSGGSHPGSDLDLVLRHPSGLRIPLRQYWDLAEALDECSLPILVQVHDWAGLPESFHREIERAHVVLKKEASAITADESASNG